MVEPKTTEDILNEARDDIRTKKPIPYATVHKASEISDIEWLAPSLAKHLQNVERIVTEGGQEIGFEELESIDGEDRTSLVVAIGSPTHAMSKKFIIQISAVRGDDSKNEYSCRVSNGKSLLPSESSTAHSLDMLVRRLGWFLIEERYLPPYRPAAAVSTVTRATAEARDVA